MQVPFVKQAQKGFTLIELSVVLVIIGLLLGGILEGQALIRASQLRAVTDEFNTYKTAIGLFQDKYKGLPGDLRDAVSYWGAAAGGTADGVDATCAGLDGSSPSIGTETCNGDGDGSISLYSGVGAPETYRAWQHLANAGLIEGKYPGVLAPGAPGGATISYNSVPGVSVPKSRLPNAGWALRGWGVLAENSAFFGATYGNFLSFFGRGTAGDWGATPILSAAEAFEIDKKIDDGSPAMGSVLTFRNSVYPDCVVGTDDAYNVGSTSPQACPLFFITTY